MSRSQSKQKFDTEIENKTNKTEAKYLEASPKKTKLNKLKIEALEVVPVKPDKVDKTKESKLVPKHEMLEQHKPGNTLMDAWIVPEIRPDSQESKHFKTLLHYSDHLEVAEYEDNKDHDHEHDDDRNDIFYPKMCGMQSLKSNILQIFVTRYN